MTNAPAIDALLKRVNSPLSLPDAFLRVDAAVRSPTSDARHIAQAVGMDQAMAGRILRMANSPLYGFSSRVDTITRAVAVIGTRQIRDLALASAVVSLCNGMVCPGISATDFWKHSFAVASFARALAAARRDPNPERYFLAGLLTTIGRLMLAQAEGERLAQCLARNTGTTLLHHAEVDAFGFHQGEVSAELMRRWLLPDMLVQSVAGQYGPVRGQASLLDAALIHCSCTVITAVGIGHSGESLAIPLDSAAWDLLCLNPDSIVPLVSEVALTAESLCDIMEVA